MPIQQMQSSKGVLDSPVARALKAYYSFGGSLAADKAGLGGPSGNLGEFQSLEMPQFGSSLVPPPTPEFDPNQGLQLPQINPYDQSQFQPQSPNLGVSTGFGAIGRRMGRYNGG